MKYILRIWLIISFIFLVWIFFVWNGNFLSFKCYRDPGCIKTITIEEVLVEDKKQQLVELEIIGIYLFINIVVSSIIIFKRNK